MVKLKVFIVRDRPFSKLPDLVSLKGSIAGKGAVIRPKSVAIGFKLKSGLNL